MSSTSADPIRFAIIGCGTIAPTHAVAISRIAGASLVAVCDTDAARAAALAEKYKTPRVYTSAEALCADNSVDAVCICTPSGMHAKHAIAAMSAGKHVIVEKPMDVSLAACDAMHAASKDHWRVLSVICQHRFDPASILVRDLITSGKLGRLMLATAEVKWWRPQSYYDSAAWRGTQALDGGGALMNQGIHTVDLLQWLLGEMETVSAHIGNFAHERIEVEDVAALLMRTRGGAIVTMSATTAAYDGFPVRIEIFGTDGSVLMEGDALKKVCLKSGATIAPSITAADAVAIARGGTAAITPDASISPTYGWGDSHRAQIENFISAIRTGEHPLIDGMEGRKPVNLILSAYESARIGRAIEIK